MYDITGQGYILHGDHSRLFVKKLAIEVHFVSVTFLTVLSGCVTPGKGMPIASVLVKSCAIEIESSFMAEEGTDYRAEYFKD